MFRAHSHRLILGTSVVLLASVWAGNRCQAASPDHGPPRSVSAPDCPVEGCAPVHEPDPNARLIELSDFLADMEDELLALSGAEQPCGMLEFSLPDIGPATGGYTATSSMLMTAVGTPIAEGTVAVTTDTVSGTIHVSMQLLVGNVPGGPYGVIWTLEQDIFLDTRLYVFGEITKQESLQQPLSWRGGWTYSPTDGLVSDPTSDAGFDGAMAEMFGCESSVAAAMPLPPLGNILGTIGNLGQLTINYIIDLFRPYKPPANCSGPKV